MGRLKLAIFLHLTAADPWEKISQQSLRLLRPGLTHLRWIVWISDDFSRATPARNRPTA